MSGTDVTAEAQGPPVKERKHAAEGRGKGQDGRQKANPSLLSFAQVIDHNAFLDVQSYPEHS